MKKYLYTENGISFKEANEKEIADLVLRDILNPDSSIQDIQTQNFVKVREIKSIMDRVLEPDIKLSFNEPDIDNYLASGRESYYYNISTKHFILMMLIAPIFLFYWIYRQWQYEYRNDKKRRFKRSFLSMLIDIFSFNSVLYMIAGDKEMMEIKKAGFDPESTGWKLYACVFGPILISFIIRGFYWLEQFLYLAASVGVIMTLLPVVRYIRDVNELKGGKYTSQTLFYYVVWLVVVYQIIMYAVLFRGMM